VIFRTSSLRSHSTPRSCLLLKLPNCCSCAYIGERKETRRRQPLVHCGIQQTPTLLSSTIRTQFVRIFSQRTFPARLIPQLRIGPLQSSCPCDITDPSRDLRRLSPLLPVSGAIAPTGRVEMLCAHSSPSFEGLKGSRSPSC
jgi:hypothetical protein